MVYGSALDSKVFKRCISANYVLGVSVFKNVFGSSCLTSHRRSMASLSWCSARPARLLLLAHSSPELTTLDLLLERVLLASLTPL